MQQAESLVFEQLLIWCQQQGWLQARGRQRTDSTHVLAAIRAVTRLECAGETLRSALNALAVVAPTWLQAQSQPEWVERYSERMEDYHLPVSKAAREPRFELPENRLTLAQWRIAQESKALDARDSVASRPATLFCFQTSTTRVL